MPLILAPCDRDPRPLKRERLCGDEALKSLTNDAELWFRDGNVIMIAEDVAFRVHRGVLSRHSGTFRGLFKTSRPADLDADLKVDGCPVIPVQDSAHDFKHLLHVLYDGLE